MEVRAWQKARAPGAGEQAVALDDADCGYLLALIARDLGSGSHVPELPPNPPQFFGPQSAAGAKVKTTDPFAIYEKLLEVQRDASLYFFCLATLQKARLKYARILSSQPFPTIEQIGPRGLLQYGHLNAPALTAFMFWRKWFFDIDNRAGQQTGYLIEPVIASAVGGEAYTAKRSPVRSHRDGKGRQVDCVREEQKDAYEIKVRVTIAASGQGRWTEELDFPIDCQRSGYRPVLVVLDETRNPKLTALAAAFKKHGGKVFIGQKAWRHLDELAGETMATFIERYVRVPLAALADAPERPVPKLTAEEGKDRRTVVITVAGETLTIPRDEKPVDEDDEGDEDTATLPS